MVMVISEYLTKSSILMCYKLAKNRLQLQHVLYSRHKQLVNELMAYFKYWLVQDSTCVNLCSAGKTVGLRSWGKKKTELSQLGQCMLIQSQVFFLIYSIFLI